MHVLLLANINTPTVHTLNLQYEYTEKKASNLGRLRLDLALSTSIVDKVKKKNQTVGLVR